MAAPIPVMVMRACLLSRASTRDQRKVGRVLELLNSVMTPGSDEHLTCYHD